MRLQILLLGFMILLGGTAGVSAGRGTEKDALIGLAVKGELSERLIESFYRYAEEQARENIGAPEEFWVWVDGDALFRRELLTGLHPDYHPAVIERLRELRKIYGERLDRYRHLALAFAFVYGNAPDGAIRDQWLDWVAAGRAVPSCGDSFGFYVEHSSQLLYPPGSLPWPLLLYVADNDAPIAERQWAMEHYQGRSLESLSRIHSDPPYVNGDYARQYTKTAGAMALDAILERGGVCSQQGYYASRVFKSLGVPSVRLLERMHAYEAWIGGELDYQVKIGGANGRKNGFYMCPLRRTRRIQYEFAMLADALKVSYDSYLDAAAVCHIYRLVPEAGRKDCVPLLEKALAKNLYCADVWHVLADACEEGILTEPEGWELYKRVRKELPQYPGLACRIVTRIMDRLLETSASVSQKDQQKIRLYLVGTARWLEENKRPWLAKDILELAKTYEATVRGTFGVLDEEVRNVIKQGQACYVWKLAPRAPLALPCELRVQIKHAAAGTEGAFYAVAWADTDEDGTPDTQIGRSLLLQVEEKGQWSEWTCSTEYRDVYLGMEIRDEASFYYQYRGSLKGYVGMGDEVFYTREPGQAPIKSVGPRFTNLRVDVKGDGLYSR